MKRYPVIYPVLLAINFVLNKAAHNITQIALIQIVRPLIVVGVVAVALMYGWKLLVKQWDRAGLVAALCAGFLFYYTPLTAWGEGLPVRKGALIAGILVFLAFVGILLFVTGKKFRPSLETLSLLTGFLNIVALIILLIPSYVIVSFLIQTVKFIPPESGMDSVAKSMTTDRGTPDIYYIVVDGYGRADMLLETYGLDNTDFVESLEARGFYIADQSVCNYMQTVLSLSSATNMEYLDTLGISSDSPDRAPLSELIKHSQVRVSLEELGYTTVALSSGFYPTEITDADVYLSPYANSPLNEFEGFLFSLTPARFFIQVFDLAGPWPGYSTHRARVLYAFQQLQEIPARIAGPKFVFAHIFSPHPPFVFDRDGQPVQPDYPYYPVDGEAFGDRQEYLDGYPDQLVYINTLLEDTIDALLSSSASPPVIIIQADHGPGMLLSFGSLADTCVRERFSILNAYYLPDCEDCALFETLTPVNSFRLIFDSYFGTNLGLVEDRGYFSSWDRPYDFIDVTDQTSTPCAVPERSE